MKQEEIIRDRIQQSINTKESILNDAKMIEDILALANEMTNTIVSGGKILICGNGGSASDSLHMAGEIVGRFQMERKGLPAIALNADVATMTAIANDYSYDAVFERAVEAYLKPNDLLIGISTSGNSTNVYQAIMKAKEMGGKTAALLGRDGGKIGKVTDYPVVVRESVTARIQECHIMIIHIVCELLETEIT